MQTLSLPVDGGRCQTAAVSGLPPASPLGRLAVLPTELRFSLWESLFEEGVKLRQINKTIFNEFLTVTKSLATRKKSGLSLRIHTQACDETMTFEIESSAGFLRIHQSYSQAERLNHGILVALKTLPWPLFSIAKFSIYPGPGAEPKFAHGQLENTYKVAINRLIEVLAPCTPPPDDASRLEIEVTAACVGDIKKMFKVMFRRKNWDQTTGPPYQYQGIGYNARFVDTVFGCKRLIEHPAFKPYFLTKTMLSSHQAAYIAQNHKRLENPLRLDSEFYYSSGLLETVHQDHQGLAMTEDARRWFLSPLDAHPRDRMIRLRSDRNVTMDGPASAIQTIPA